MTGDDLDRIEAWLAPLLAELEPRNRRKIAMRVMRLARRANAARIAKNVEPEGGAMTPRRPRAIRDRKSKVGRMFQRIGKAKNLKIAVDSEGGTLSFANPLIESTAAEHHFGLTGFVGRTRDGRVIRTRYDARRLLGFGREQDQFLDEVVDQLGL
jgi:phage virion morphogenesis protein